MVNKTLKLEYASYKQAIHIDLDCNLTLRGSKNVPYWQSERLQFSVEL